MMMDDAFQKQIEGVQISFILMTMSYFCLLFSYFYCPKTYLAPYFTIPKLIFLVLLSLDTIKSTFCPTSSRSFLLPVVYVKILTFYPFYLFYFLIVLLKFSLFLFYEISSFDSHSIERCG